MPDSVTPRRFSWDDVGALHDLVAQWQTRSGIFIHLGDMYWALRNTPDGEPTSAMWVWPRSDGTLAAVAWLDQPTSADMILAPDAPRSLLSAVLDHVEHEQRKTGATTISFVARRGDTALSEELARRGYARTDTGDLRLRRALDAERAAAPLPPGFTIHDMAGDDDIERRVSVERAVWGTNATADVWRLFAARLPNYRPELDLVAIAPDGSGACAITCWLDERSHRAEIEAVATIPSMRQMGIGKAVITEGLRRLHGAGATEVALYTNIGNVASLALYRSCGFEVVAEDYAWTRAP